MLTWDESKVVVMSCWAFCFEENPIFWKGQSFTRTTRISGKLTERVPTMKKIMSHLDEQVEISRSFQCMQGERGKNNGSEMK
jgi:hypothetical protein